MGGGGEPAPSVRSAFMASDNPNVRSQTIRLHLFCRTPCNLYPSGTTAPVPLLAPQFYPQAMQSRPFRRAFCGGGRQIIIAVCSVRVVSGGFFLFFGLKTENRARAGNGAAGNGMASRVDGRRGARRSFTLRIDARGKVFVPQDVKCRRKLRKLSRISKKPSFEGF